MSDLCYLRKPRLDPLFMTLYCAFDEWDRLKLSKDRN